MYIYIYISIHTCVYMYIYIYIYIYGMSSERCPVRKVLQSEGDRRAAVAFEEPSKNLRTTCICSICNCIN